MQFEIKDAMINNIEGDHKYSNILWKTQQSQKILTEEKKYVFTVSTQPVQSSCWSGMWSGSGPQSPA